MKDELFINIYKAYYKPVCFYIIKMVKDRILAEDLAQETFIKIFNGLEAFDQERRLDPWVYRIAHNTCMDYIRKNHVDHELINEIIQEDSADNSPEHILLNREKGNKISEALQKLGNKYRTPLLLRDFNQLSYKEIASILKLSEQSVKTQIHRARQRFQNIYTEAY